MMNSLNIPVRVVKELFESPCNIGTEGSIHGYLCDNLDSAAPKELSTVLLTVFVPKYEDFSFRLITPMPASQGATSELLIQTLEKMKELYTDISMIERNSHGCTH